MSNNRSVENHWLINSIVDDLNSAREIIDTKKLQSKFLRNFNFSTVDLELLRNVLNVFELAALDLLNKDFTENESERNLFALICAEYFNMAQNLPLPESPIEKIKTILKFISFSYLGEKWEDGRRYLIEKEECWNFEFPNSSLQWDLKLLYTSYRSIILLVKKNNWKDLTEATGLISSLRKSQEDYEKIYFDSVESQYKRGAAYEVASFYHLAKTVEYIGIFHLEGMPNSSKLLGVLAFHFDKAINYCRLSGNIEFELILSLIHEMFKKMILNSIWRISENINSRVTKFVKNVTKLEKPIFELLYPQRISILEQGLLDPAHKAIVINLPTSSGKTLIAEFRILQALNNFSDTKGWIAYVAPTRALVNQITLRLKKDLGPIGVKVEKMSGALELDAFEDNLISKENSFDVLVTTPEKLNLLIRQGIESKINRDLVLLVADEIQNLESEERGLTLELMLATVQNDCAKANFLLLTPFVPNGEEIAKWLDPTNPKSISIELDWQPNDKVVGYFYCEGSKRDWKTYYKPLLTTQDTVVINDRILIGENKDEMFPHAISTIKSKKYLLTAIVATQLQNTGNNIVIAGTVGTCWEIAKYISNNLPVLTEIDDKIILVQKFIASELGENFPLIDYLKHGVGVHHAGLPEEIKGLMEWLMEEGLLKTLVATTTIAQGINFPVSSIFMASYSYPYRRMPTRDFWNLAGRAGRMDQNSLGLIGIASKSEVDNDSKIIAEFVLEKTKNLVSILTKMVESLDKFEADSNLARLSYIPQWSSFLQYIAHMYKQSESIEKFISESEITLRKTYGFSLLTEEQQTKLLSAVNNYATKLDQRPELATLSDATGFSPETVGSTMSKVQELGIQQDDWNSSRLFSNNSESLKSLVGVMLKIPEIKESLKNIISGSSINNETLANVINQWTAGKDINIISNEFWKGETAENLSHCVTALYSKIANFATWGLASILKLPGSGIDFEQLTDEERRKLKNIPAMIYYGVNTDEAILMRTNSVPRSISLNLGKVFQRAFPDVYAVNNSEVNDWINGISDEIWNSVVPKGKLMTGYEYKKVWQKLSGNS